MMWKANTNGEILWDIKIILQRVVWETIKLC